MLANCVIHETYAAAPNYVGHAFHFYDQNLKKWAQHYIDMTATPFDWIGEFKDGRASMGRT